MPLRQAHEGMNNTQELPVFHGVSIRARSSQIANLTALVSGHGFAVI